MDLNTSVAGCDTKLDSWFACIVWGLRSKKKKSRHQKKSQHKKYQNEISDKQNF
jgi:murein endopeptidase